MNEALHAWHPDHLGARRGCAHQADGHAHAPVRTHHGQGLRLSAHSIAQAIVIAVLPALFGASFHTNALKLLAVAAVVVLETGVLLMPVHEHRGRGAVRYLLTGLPTNIWLNVGALTGSTAAAITAASIPCRNKHQQMVTRERQHADPGEDAD